MSSAEGYDVDGVSAAGDAPSARSEDLGVSTPHPLAAAASNHTFDYTPLPVSSWVASALHVAEAALPLQFACRPVVRRLSRALVRRLALLEHLVATSPPLRLLGISSALPFLGALVVLAVQARRIWKTQKWAAVEALVALGPAWATAKALRDLEDRRTSEKSRTEAGRWLAFWMVYAVWGVGERVKLSGKRATDPGPSVGRMLGALQPWAAKLRRLLQPLLGGMVRSLSKRLRSPAPSPPRRPGFREPRPLGSARLPPLTDPSKLLTIPETLFGRDSTLYYILKILFFGWASSESSRGASKLWEMFVRPFVRGTTFTSSGSPQPHRKLRVVVIDAQAPELISAALFGQAKPVPALSSKVHPQAPPRAPNTSAPSPPASPPPVAPSAPPTLRAVPSPYPSSDAAASQLGMTSQDVARLHELAASPRSHGLSDEEDERHRSLAEGMKSLGGAWEDTMAGSNARPDYETLGSVVWSPPSHKRKNESEASKC